MNDPMADSGRIRTTRRALVGGLAGLSVAGLVSQRAVAQTAVATPPATTIQVALQSSVDTKKLSKTRLAEVAAALQTQVNQHFKLAWNWNHTATVTSVLDGTPTSDTALIILVDELSGNPDMHGYLPGFGGFAHVLYTDDDSWSHGASHECLEMLADPDNMQTHLLPSLKSGQGNVAYTQEICDPCQTAFYLIGDVRVSDFVLPAYYGSNLTPVASARYSYDGSITSPLDILVGGTLPWTIPSSGDFWCAYRSSSSSAIEFQKDMCPS
jgi:hypothetical protein